VILVDANLLLCPYHPRAEQHEESRAWLEAVLSGPDLVRFAWLTLWAFLRIATNPACSKAHFPPPKPKRRSRPGSASQPQGFSNPGERHWDILRGLVRDGQATGPLVMDAVLAAIALEHGATICTTDRDFARFPGLKWINPLAENP
jgi:toxin-antitoxin system PIN domain toxin